MNEETIRARLAVLRQTAAELQANFSAAQGAIQDCEYWLAQLRREEAEANAPTSSPPTPVLVREEPA